MLPLMWVFQSLHVFFSPPALFHPYIPLNLTRNTCLSLPLFCSFPSFSSLSHNLSPYPPAVFLSIQKSPLPYLSFPFSTFIYPLLLLPPSLNASPLPLLFLLFPSFLALPIFFLLSPSIYNSISPSIYNSSFSLIKHNNPSSPFSPPSLSTSPFIPPPLSSLPTLLYLPLFILSSFTLCIPLWLRFLLGFLSLSLPPLTHLSWRVFFTRRERSQVRGGGGGERKGELG